MGRPSNGDSIVVAVRIPRGLHDVLVREARERGLEVGESVPVSTIIRQCIRKQLVKTKGAGPEGTEDA